MAPTLVLSSTSSTAVREAAAVLDALHRGGQAPQTFTRVRLGADENGDLRIESERLTLHPQSREVKQLTRLVAEHGQRRSA